MKRVCAALVALLSAATVSPAAAASSPEVPSVGVSADPVRLPVVPAPATAPNSDVLDAKLREAEGEPAKPPLSALRIGGEVVAVVAGGTGCAAALGRAGSGSDWQRAGGAVLGAGLVAPLGVYAVGSLGDETGSLGATIAGPIIGFNYSREYAPGALPAAKVPPHDAAPREAAGATIVPTRNATPDLFSVGAAGRF